MTFACCSIVQLEKYDDMRRRYRDRFFTTGTAVIEAQEDDIEKDSDSTKMSYDDLFEDREGDYKGE